MKEKGTFKIPFSGLKLGTHRFEYDVLKPFFDEFKYDDFENIKVKVRVNLVKKENILEFEIKHQGIIELPCDLTNELFEMPIKGNLKFVVKFGDSYNSDHDELVVLPHGAHQIVLDQFIYEMVVLSVPQKRIHPGVKDGTLKSKALDILDKLSPSNDAKDNDNNDIDPRWDRLKDLLN